MRVLLLLKVDYLRLSELVVQRITIMEFRVNEVMAVYMHSPPDSIIKGIMFSGGPFTTLVHSFIHPDRSCYHDISRTASAISMKLTGNIH